MDENGTSKLKLIAIISSIGALPIILGILALFIVVLNELGLFESVEKKDDSLAKGGYTTVCENNAAQLLAKMLYLEVNGTDTFTKLSTAAVIINNAGGISYDKIYNLTDTQYHLFSTYKDIPFEEYVPEKYRGEVLYIAEAVLSGKYRLPSNMRYQASSGIVQRYGEVWTSIPAYPKDVYFGYIRGQGLSSTDITGNSLPSEAYNLSTSVSYYKNLAKSLEKSDYSSYSTASVCKVAGECGFSISSTPLSKSEFKTKLEEYASKATENKTVKEVFAQNADNIYDIAISNNVNPELIIIRAIAEGFEPGGTTNNYWGINCTNTGGGKDCRKYATFNLGVKGYVEIVAKYDSLISLMKKYAYIGDYWYTMDTSNPSGDGGCYYAPHIYTDNNMPERVKQACATGAPSCVVKGSTTNCTATTDEDQAAYAAWQVKNMSKLRKQIFGLDETSGCSSILDADIQTIINLSDAEAWQALTGTSTGYMSVSRATMDSRVTTITVPIRVWASSNANDYTKTSSQKKITVNKVLAPLFTSLFTDIYNEATDFVINPSEMYCYNYRNGTNSSRLSGHAFGVACDLNWSTIGNGYGAHVYTKEEWNNLKESKAKYQILYKNSKVVEILHKYTLSWGGEWRSTTDAMHFSFIRDESRATLQQKYK